MNECKSWWRSRQLWFNAICGALYAIEMNVGLLQPLMPLNVYQVFVPILMVGNAVLRIVTTQALSK